MTSRLDRFVADARARVAAGAYRPDAGESPLASNGSLADAVRADPDSIIAEVKPRSPSEGRILTGDPSRLFEAYRTGGATALSVLADADHFDGSPALVRAAHAAGLPILWKDFVVDPEQIAAAHHHGASAVLLIERCFTDAKDREALVEQAHAAGLEVLLEVHGMAEWERAADSEAALFGVNARNLATLEVDPEGSLDVVAAIHAAGRPVVALSGISSRAARLRAKARGANGVLVGTHLVKHADPHLALRALRRPLAKVCGITDETTLVAALDAGADMVGFVVGADSPRSITPIQAHRLNDVARAAGARTVLVTPGDNKWQVREWCRVARPDFVQLHRLDPDPEWVHSMGAIPTHVLWAVAPHERPRDDGVGFVVDTPSQHGTGGSGQTHAWTPIEDLRFSLIAGGLDADNAADALRATGAWGADASSGLESTPGRKDPKKVAAFVASVHGVQDA